ncbi:MAG: GGDEF domain-containing protein [Noviherbaspirillum sp.]
MLLVWRSLQRTGIAGVREWTIANVLALLAHVLYALGRELPPVLAYEAANATYAAAALAILIGFRRFFGRPVSLAGCVVPLSLFVVAIAYFHYVHDSYPLRTMTVSLFQVGVCGGIAYTVYRWRKSARSRYPYLFTMAMAGAIAIGNAVRAVLHAMNPSEAASLLQPSAWNVFFLSAGSQVLPALTLGALMMVHDMMMARAEHAANRDFLTGAWSRRAFFEMADRELNRARRAGHPLALLLIDIDHFKRINDTHGHAAGDQVLVDMSLRVENVIRGIDYFARIGGEEFAALLPDADRDAALAVAERLRSTLAGESGRHGGAPYTVSIGLAVLRDSDSFHELMRRADAALYQAKASGRNQVIGESVL